MRLHLFEVEDRTYLGQNKIRDLFKDQILKLKKKKERLPEDLNRNQISMSE